jgi:hypothetical protein
VPVGTTRAQAAASTSSNGIDVYDAAMDDDHQRLIARNEVRFRSANEAKVTALGEFEGEVQRFEIMCECAVSECDAMIELTAADYRHLRSSPRWFAVMPDHVFPAVEHKVEDRASWWIIQKDGAGADVAEATS